jgi:ATP-binding protein involved in chromosome partitioning
MSLNPDQILAVLAEVIDPNTQKKLAVTAKNCEIRLEGIDVSITVPLGYPSHNGQAELRKRIETI